MSGFALRTGPRPWEIRRAAERAAMEAEGQKILTRAVRALLHLTAEQRAEGERLIALPYGAEGNGLRLFLLEMQMQGAA